MPNRDWSLVFFTTLAQWSVGIILWLTWPVYQEHGLTPVFETDLNLQNPVLLALVFIVIATLSSLLHLGNPANAPKALNNLSGSWLSREILAIGIFSVSLALVVILAWLAGNSEFLKPLMVFSSICGLAFLWMMIQIYVIPTIPAWNNWYTPVSFASTALSLGLITMLFLHGSGHVNTSDQIIGYFWIVLVVILLIEIVSGFVHQSSLVKMDTGMEKLIFDKGAFHWVFLARMVILIIANLVVIAFILNPDWFQGNDNSLWISLLFASVIVEELLGRVLFYSSYFRIGV